MVSVFEEFYEQIKPKTKNISEFGDTKLIWVTKWGHYVCVFNSRRIFLSFFHNKNNLYVSNFDQDYTINLELDQDFLDFDV